ncbi:MAG TPA: hypothetical protein QGF58_08580 [Myxococcota bacterium]|nr:hypothetical protein [Myxococcota bacterium]
MLLLVSLSLAAEPPQDEPAPEKTFLLADRLEFTFGQSMVIVDQALYGQDEERILPVQGSLFLGEYLWRPRVSIVGLVNVPQTPIRHLVDGDIVEEHSAGAIAAGAAWAPAVLQLSESAFFKPQVAGLAGRTFRSTAGDQFFPMAAVKLNMSTYAGFTMYVGGAYAFREDTLAVIYGVGHRF